MPMIKIVLPSLKMPLDSSLSVYLDEISGENV